MFNNLRNEIVSLNKDVSNIANSERAKKLRKKLLSIGLPIAIIGGIGLFTCFVLFATAGADGFSSTGFGFSARLIVPFVLIIPFALITGIGSSISSLGFKILISGYAANLADEVVGNNCPNCKNKIEKDEEFCGNCGTKLLIKCKKCNHLNDSKDNFCKKCGTKLQ